MPLNQMRLRWLVVCLRLLLGSIFIWASWHKIIDPAGFARIIANYQLVPPALINPLAYLLPWVEAVCGACLITGRLVHGSAALAGILMALFTIAYALSLVRGLNIECGCFSSAGENSTSGYVVLFRDALILALAASVWWINIHRQSPGLRMDHKPSNRPMS